MGKTNITKMRNDCLICLEISISRPINSKNKNERLQGLLGNLFKNLNIENKNKKEIFGGLAEVKEIRYLYVR